MRLPYTECATDGLRLQSVLQGELTSRQCAESRQTTPCIFEYIYLARPDSVLNDIPVYNFQLGLGSRLAARIR